MVDNFARKVGTGILGLIVAMVTATVLFRGAGGGCGGHVLHQPLLSS